MIQNINPTALQQIIDLVERLGFPTFVAIWMLVFSNRQIKLLSAAIDRLTNAFERANIILHHTINTHDNC